MIHERVISSRAFHCWFSMVDKHHQTTWQVPEDFCVFINGFLHWPSLPRLFFVVQFVPWKPNSGNLRKNDSWQTIANQSEGADVFKGFWFTSHTCSENWWLEDEFPFGARLIFRTMLVLESVYCLRSQVVMIPTPGQSPHRFGITGDPTEFA